MSALKSAVATALPPLPAWFDTCNEWRSPRPDELICFAALHCPADIMLPDIETLDRVAEAYIAHCRKAGFWLHRPGKDPIRFHETGCEGYRDRVADYRGTLRWHLAGKPWPAAADANAA